MLQFEEYKVKLNNMKPALEELRGNLNLDQAAREVDELEMKSSQPCFWDKPEESQKVVSRLGALKGKIEGFNDLYSQWEDLYYDASALQCGFVFETGEEFLKVMETDLFQKIVDEMDQVNIHALNCAFVGGMRHVIGKKPYTTPAEMKGLKLRVPNSTTYLECFEAMGASPMGMAASEQMGALSAGTIDALDQSISLMYSTKSYELVDQVTLLAQQPLADALFCSTKWWNSIPAEYQEIIEEELHEAGLRYNQYSVENESKMREEMEAAGVQFHEADRQAFLDMGCSDLVLKYGIGQELLDTLAEIRAAE